MCDEAQKRKALAAITRAFQKDCGWEGCKSLGTVCFFSSPLSSPFLKFFYPAIAPLFQGVRS